MKVLLLKILSDESPSTAAIGTALEANVIKMPGTVPVHAGLPGVRPRVVRDRTGGGYCKEGSFREPAR